MGLRVGVRYWVLGVRFWVLGFGFWVFGFWFLVLGFGFWILGCLFFRLGSGLFLLRLRRREYKIALESGLAYGIILNPVVGPGLFGHGVLRVPGIFFPEAWAWISPS